MRKVSAYILLTAVLLGAAISNGHAATGEPGDNAAVTPVDGTHPPESGAAGDALPSEPGTASDTTPPAPGADGETKIKTALPATEETYKLKPGKSGKPGDKSEIEVPPSEFWGRYFGAKFGIINSSASGATNAPSAETLSYGVQGGYLQAGRNWDLRALVVGVGAYADWNNNAIHSNNVAYSSSAYGLDFKLGLPMNYILPYVKLGYGYSTGNKNDDLRIVSQYSRNIAAGVEYNVAPRWSLIAEIKVDNFSNRDRSTTIHNKLFTFGFNYYLDKPIDSEKEKIQALDLPIPEPILDPNAAPDAPPPP